MRIDEIFARMTEDGRVVKGVNTTQDVGPGEIKRQAAKLGFAVTKDGVPVRIYTKTHAKDLIMKEAADGDLFDWTSGGGSRTKKIGDTTIIYGVGRSGDAELISLRTPGTKRRKGSAREALQRFCDEADKHGFTLKLAASPLDKKTHPGRLQAFYRSFGFEPTGRTINQVGDPEMLRRPRR